MDVLLWIMWIIKYIVLAIIIYLSLPAVLGLILAIFLRGWYYGDLVPTFDFFADILYPWRWEYNPFRTWVLRVKRLRRRRKGMKTVTIYTDGACSGNPGPGGWGAILMYGAHKKELSGGDAYTTNNRMELTGVITALEALKEPCTVELYSDSKYVIEALEKGWARSWRIKGWVKADKKPALNPDLWQKLLDLCDYHDVRLHWVKGHASNEYNNRCDQLAVAESLKFKQLTPP